ncbi:MAG: hypothetical protein N2445_00875 [Acidobacteria bacterium]|nr:hypothetical protein [Acidobacteriota bacterium]
MKFKILSISYINSAPLWWALKEKKDFDLSFAKPTEILKKFKNGDFDVALLPTLEYLKSDLSVAAHCGILSNGNVKSVLIFYRDKLEEVEKIYLDPNSKTSQAMTKYLLKEKKFKFQRKEIDLNSLEKNEGQLLIGDKALKLRKCGFKTIDVATLWKERTNHSALFALWAKKRGGAKIDWETVLYEALKESLKDIDQIIKWAHSKTGIDKRILRNYFTKSIFYKFGEEGKQALDFYKEVFCEKRTGQNL